ncbi:DNA-binding response OmpR family regulator [Flavobacterium sp. CG_9.1]|uniref:DNA-binding response regulator, OmpR family, contains REC and winged-helix (WHTH) domain n=1 Tax=Flavobacterium xanthum TaxID=69322 RepID=A0A1M7LK76_9FLAO|nr:MULTISPECIES: response regulator transcription factor [Flavobacterium]MBG6062453.1 DNA-binding response OmpR family regulator [Flavobacterium sp. CG_9.1]SHM78514.1 DNA-binding response regulator, OmpR family, contains REC and winged-helix (wHTH) domain [Flavobacterium xanthum]
MSKKIRIILAEDEPALAQIIKESLETRNFEVILCKDGEEAFDAFKNEKIELVVLDVMMPKKDGFSVAKDIRKLDNKIPIVFLTAKSQTQDVVDGFNFGGNDYLKKPFSMEELIVRIHSLLGRKINLKNDENILIGNYVFNLTKQTLHCSEAIISLTHREAVLLDLLSENKNKIVNRSLILNKIWGNDDFFTGRSMDVFITKLRKKLSLDPNIQIINVRGQGCKLIC